MEKDVILSIGQYLKKARENKGFSIEEVSEETKIKPRIIESIEQNKFDEFGGTGYAKALIESYAKFLDANDEKLKSLIDTRFPSKLTHNAKFNSIQPRKILIPTNFIAIISLVILVIILIITSIKLSQAGLLKSPFKKAKVEKVEKKSEENKKESKKDNKDSEKKTTNQASSKAKKIKIKPKMLQEAAETASLEEKNKDKNINLNKRALRDSSDYLKELMFKGKKNPFL